MESFYLLSSLRQLLLQLFDSSTVVVSLPLVDVKLRVLDGRLAHTNLISGGNAVFEQANSTIQGTHNQGLIPKSQISVHQIHRL